MERSQAMRKGKIISGKMIEKPFMSLHSAGPSRAFLDFPSSFF
jgi:hypothetical protein